VGTFLAGLAIGAGLALLLAPQSGEELRRKIRRQAKRARIAAEDLADEAKHRAQDVTEDLKHRAGELLDDARHEVAGRVDDARHAVNRKKRDLSRAVDAGRAAARDAREAFERRIAQAKSAENES
jgi:gas vesicle protein